MTVASAPATQTKAPTASSFPARPARWMRSSELAAAQLEADARLISLEGESRDALAKQTRKRLREEISFIGNSQFADAKYAASVFADSLDLPPRQTQLGIAALRKSGVDLPIHLGRLCEAPLLTPEQERTCFSE